MNSRERVITTLGHSMADRVPLMEIWIDPVVTDAILPGGDWNDLAVHLGMDVVTVPTMIYSDDEVEWIDTGKRIFRDKWGGMQRLTHESLPVSVGPARIETTEDLLHYHPPVASQSPVLEKVRELKRRFPHGEKAIAVIGESGWAPAVYLRGGLENFFMDFATRPDFVRDLLAIGAEYHRTLYPLAIEAGADIVLLGDDYASTTGLMISPLQWRELVLPCDQAVVASIKQAGGYCIKHTDGDIRAIMDDLVGMGIDALGPLEPLPGMELTKVLERYPDRISVVGNVSVDLLSRGTEHDVIAETRKLLANVSCHGGHILSSGNSISSSVKPENFLAMVRTAQQFGTYPIDATAIGG